jgi:hypothetical protein
MIHFIMNRGNAMLKKPIIIAIAAFAFGLASPAP